jgi:hypothetical protein
MEQPTVVRSLGDVVVSAGVVQFDFGRQFSDRVIRKDTIFDDPTPKSDHS